VHHGNVELAELLIKEFKCEVDFTDKITGDCYIMFLSLYNILCTFS